MNQQQISAHFIDLAKGTHPVKKKGVILLPTHHVQTGKGDTDVTDLKLVSPTKDAVNQAKSDLKRGIEDTDIYENAIRDDVKKKKLSQSLSTVKRRPKKSSPAKKRKPKRKKKKKNTKQKRKTKPKKTKKKSK